MLLLDIISYYYKQKTCVQFINKTCVLKMHKQQREKESGESDRKKPKQRHSAGQSTCSCSTLIGQRLSLFEAGRERESAKRERIMCALLAALREIRTACTAKPVCVEHPVYALWLFLHIDCETTTPTTRIVSVVVRRSLCAVEAYTQRCDAFFERFTRYENSNSSSETPTSTYAR